MRIIKCMILIIMQKTLYVLSDKYHNCFFDFVVGFGKFNFGKFEKRFFFPIQMYFQHMLGIFFRFVWGILTKSLAVSCNYFLFLPFSMIESVNVFYQLWLKNDRVLDLFYKVVKIFTILAFFSDLEFPSEMLVFFRPSSPTLMIDLLDPSPPKPFGQAFPVFFCSFSFLKFFFFQKVEKKMKERALVFCLICMLGYPPNADSKKKDRNHYSDFGLLVISDLFFNSILD